MIKTIDMRGMRYLNLFSKITRIPTRHFFMYNENIIFCVPRISVSKAIGKEGINVKKLNQILKKKIKVIPSPEGDSKESIQRFIRNVISPTEFNDLEIKDDEIIITGGSQNKAALIGRERRRLLELQKISSDYFGKTVKIV